jgi:hypothetical protein
MPTRIVWSAAMPRISLDSLFSVQAARPAAPIVNAIMYRRIMDWSPFLYQSV